MALPGKGQLSVRPGLLHQANLHLLQHAVCRSGLPAASGTPPARGKGRCPPTVAPLLLGVRGGSSWPGRGTSGLTARPSICRPPINVPSLLVHSSCLGEQCQPSMLAVSSTSGGTTMPQNNYAPCEKIPPLFVLNLLSSSFVGEPLDGKRGRNISPPPSPTKHNFMKTL